MNPGRIEQLDTPRKLYQSRPPRLGELASHDELTKVREADILGRYGGEEAMAAFLEKRKPDFSRF